MRRFAGLMIVLACCGGLAQANAFEDVRKQILEKFSKVKTLKASFETEVVREQPQATVIARGSGTIEMQRSKDETKLRMDLLDVVDQTGPQKNETFQRTRTTIADGKYQYLLSEFSGEISAFRHKYDDNQNAFDSEAIMRSLAANHNVTVLPTEKINGEEVFVLESMPIVYSDKEPIIRKIWYFAKNSGLMIKRTGFDSRDIERDQFVLKNIKINEEIDPARFEFNPPAGVNVQDMTGETPPQSE